MHRTSPAELPQALQRMVANAVSEGVAGLQGLARKSKGSAEEGVQRARSLAETVEAVLRRQVGRVRAAEAADLPVPGYDTLNAADAVGRVRVLRLSEDVRVILAYEAAHKDRKTVRDAGTARLAELEAG